MRGDHRAAPLSVEARARANTDRISHRAPRAPPVAGVGPLFRGDLKLSRSVGQRVIEELTVTKLRAKKHAANGRAKVILRAPSERLNLVERTNLWSRLLRAGHPADSRDPFGAVSADVSSSLERAQSFAAAGEGHGGPTGSTASGAARSESAQLRARAMCARGPVPAR